MTVFQNLPYYHLKNSKIDNNQKYCRRVCIWLAAAAGEYTKDILQHTIRGVKKMKRSDFDNKIKIDLETGEELYRGTRKLTVTYQGLSRTIDMPGWYSADGSLGQHSQQDMKISDRALNLLKAKKEGLPSPDEIKHIRKQFKLSQVEAGKLIGGGTRAFQKYESGDVLPSRTLANLLAVLARDSNVINILRDIADFRQKCSVKE